MDQSKMTFLQNVLRYSTSHTESSGENSGAGGSETTAAAASTVREMSPERRKWLENALDNMTMNPVDEMKKCIKYLTDEPTSEDNLEKQVSALETLRDWCEDMNFAIDFHKIDQYKLIFALLNHERAELRALTCDLIGTLAQNNPYCQETLLAAKIMPLVLYRLDKDTEAEVRIKALYALSCMCRDYEPGQEKLVETANGVDILIRALDSPVEKLQLKGCFLFASICASSARLKQLLTDKRLVETLIGLYRRADSSIHEHVLAAINILVDENPRAVAQALEMNGLDFKKILNERIQAIADDPRHDEERDMAKNILDKYFSN